MLMCSEKLLDSGGHVFLVVGWGVDVGFPDSLLMFF